MIWPGIGVGLGPPAGGVGVSEGVGAEVKVGVTSGGRVGVGVRVGPPGVGLGVGVAVGPSGGEAPRARAALIRP